MADYKKLFVAEELRLDGSNFIEWYLRLREVLSTHDELYVLHETLEEKLSWGCHGKFFLREDEFWGH